VPDLYLLHFAEPYQHARHYLGYAVGTGRGRSYARAQARGAALGAHELVMAVQAAGIAIHVADVFEGEGRARQRAMRRGHHLHRYCPLCTGASMLAGEPS
jgi:hypothetical protein